MSEAPGRHGFTTKITRAGHALHATFSAGLWKPRSTSCWRPTLFPGPDVDSRRRRQDRRVLLVTVGDGTSFPTAAQLASYADLAPTTRSSGPSIHGEHAPRDCNRQLKRAMFLPPSPA